MKNSFLLFFFLGVWGTDVEIFAAIHLLKTSIFVYSAEKKQWQFFNKTMDLKTNIDHQEKCIYIRHFNNIRYDVVNDVY